MRFLKLEKNSVKFIYFYKTIARRTSETKAQCYVLHLPTLETRYVHMTTKVFLLSNES